MTNTGARLIIGILSLGYLCLSIILLTMLLFSWPLGIGSLESFLANLNVRWTVGLSALVVFLLSLVLLGRSFGRRPVKFSILQETELGQVNITMSALEQLVIKGASAVSGVREVKPTLKLTGRGITLLLKVHVLPDINIPQTTSELQRIVRDYLLKTSGTSLHEIKVQVTKVSMEAARLPKISRVE